VAEAHVEYECGECGHDDDAEMFLAHAEQILESMKIPNDVDAHVWDRISSVIRLLMSPGDSRNEPFDLIDLQHIISGENEVRFNGPDTHEFSRRTSGGGSGSRTSSTQRSRQVLDRHAAMQYTQHYGTGTLNYPPPYLMNNSNGIMP
jgi:hypothetical protein